MGAAGTNGNSTSGIRITWFLNDGTILLRSPYTGDNNVYNEYKQNGYLIAPQGAVAVNVTWWTAESNNYLYITK